MSSHYTHVPSLREYLALLANTTQQEPASDLQQLIDQHLATNVLAMYGPSVVFVLELSCKQYHFLSKNVEELSGYANDLFFKEGLDFMLKTRHADDVRLFSEVIFKQQLQFMRAQSVAE
jgi:hypothetical protein